MKFKRKIIPDSNYSPSFITKKRLYEDEIDFDQLRLYRLDRIKKELSKKDIGACILFDPVNIRYALDSVNMSIFTMHNLHRYCFIPVNGPIILFEFFNCEHLSKHLKLIDEIRPGISWDYFAHGDQVEKQIKKWTDEVQNLMNQNCGKNKRLAIDVCNGPGALALNKIGLQIIDAKEIVEQARVIKSKEEIQCMKASLEVCEKGVQLMKSELKAGITEDELWALFHKTNIYRLFFIISELLRDGKILTSRATTANHKQQQSLM